ncbi:MAG: 30S ribosomal protein S17 [Bdellovibrionales bacterium]|nr:30S ribosomal protein S17 [Bdellovibrionales bacterium]
MAPEKKTEKKASAPKKAAAAPKKAAKPEATEAKAVISKQVSRGLAGRRVLVGTVVSDKMKKTIVVTIDRNVRHGMYMKYVTKSRRFKAHDEKNTAKIGDLVEIVESRPMSSDKRWVLKSIIRKNGQAPEANV